MTVAADDRKGRNECPEFLRITAQKVAVSRDETDSEIARVEKRKKPIKLKKGCAGVRCWIIKDGVKIEFLRLLDLALYVDKKENTIARKRLVYKAKGIKSVQEKTYLWGWY